ncbi:hypothetical protein [Mesoflavibacter profundi]|uniref:hypothetical protein n=1 Tax=Mesoflavibacter profundi TaxID=2708110 RepID=UPI003513F8B5
MFTGLLMAIIGTVIVAIINYIRGLSFSIINLMISFILIWIFGYFLAKPKSTNNKD